MGKNGAIGPLDRPGAATNMFQEVTKPVSACDLLRMNCT